MGFTRKIRALACAALALFASSNAASADALTVFAASSLKESLEEIAQSFLVETGHQITLSFAGSSALARQIEFGAPADVFISASSDWMDYLAERSLIDPESRLDLLSNQLVVIGPVDSVPLNLGDADALTDRLQNGRLAMALTEAVPAGIYGKEALETLGLWEGVAQQIAQTDSARAALALVAIGAAPLGVVYRTDARAEPKVDVVAEIPSDTHASIRYPVALVTASDSPAAQRLLDYLGSPTADKVFERNGFILSED